MSNRLVEVDWMPIIVLGCIISALRASVLYASGQDDRAVAWTLFLIVLLSFAMATGVKVGE